MDINHIIIGKKMQYNHLHPPKHTITQNTLFVNNFISYPLYLVVVKLLKYSSISNLNENTKKKKH